MCLCLSRLQTHIPNFLDFSCNFLRFGKRKRGREKEGGERFRGIEEKLSNVSVTFLCGGPTHLYTKYLRDFHYNVLSPAVQFFWFRASNWYNVVNTGGGHASREGWRHFSPIALANQLKDKDRSNFIARENRSTIPQRTAFRNTQEDTLLVVTLEHWRCHS